MSASGRCWAIMAIAASMSFGSRTFWGWIVIPSARAASCVSLQAKASAGLAPFQRTATLRFAPNKQTPTARVQCDASAVQLEGPAVLCPSESCPHRLPRAGSFQPGWGRSSSDRRLRRIGGRKRLWGSPAPRARFAMRRRWVLNVTSGGMRSASARSPHLAAIRQGGLPAL